MYQLNIPSYLDSTLLTGATRITQVVPTLRANRVELVEEQNTRARSSRLDTANFSSKDAFALVIIKQANSLKPFMAPLMQRRAQKQELNN